MTLCDPTDCRLQAPLSMGFSRQEYWSGQPFPSPSDLPDPGTELRYPTMQADSLLLSHQGRLLSQFSSVQFSSVAQSCLTLCNPMNHSTPGFPVHHQLPEFTQTRIHPVSNIDWRFISYMIVYMFQCRSPKSSHPCPLPQSPKVHSIHLCLFCCLAYRVIITIFLNSIYMC